MASTSETGHAKNVADFDELISFVTGYRESYNPSKATIKLDALKALSDHAKHSINAVSSMEPAHKSAVAAREVVFIPLSKLTTRTMNSIKATDTTVQVDENARTLVRKIQGVRATAKKTEDEKKALAEKGKEVVEISTSQMSYDSRLDNFFKLIQLLSSVPEHNPNETELKIEHLNTILDDLKAKNAAGVESYIPLSNARISRNNLLYKENTGLYDVALDVKNYIKSVFGATSPQYKQVSKIKFTAPR